jgi:hypothetical protein
MYALSKVVLPSIGINSRQSELVNYIFVVQIVRRV